MLHRENVAVRHSRIVLLAASVGFGLLLVILQVIAGRSDATMAAPRPDYFASDSLAPVNLPLYQAIQCTLNTTTTADYLGNNHSFGHAANLADYSNLALAYGDVPTDPIQVVPDEDYFQLANATPGYTYDVEVDPNGTGNYNLGIVVYNASRTPIMTDSNTLDGNSASVTLDADDVGPYYFKVFQVSAYCTGGTYDLDVSVSTPPGSDPYEPNDTRGTAYVFPVVTSASATDANFVPSSTDQDWFAFYVKSGRNYRASTSNLVGVDTYVEVFNEDGNRVAYDNDSGGGFASRAEWQASYDGYYYIKVTNQVSTSSGSDTYDLTVAQISVSATSTPRPAVANPDADRCDRTELGNYDFDHACVISADVSEEFNFVPPPYGGSDNDYLKMWVKPGLLFKCGTSKLSAGVDPNMILYDNNRNAIGGNDDVEPGNFNSYLAYYATYEGWMYLLVGTGDRTPPDLSDSSYTLRCDMEVPGQATATSTPESAGTPAGGATPTRSPQPGTATPVATPTPYPGLTVRPLTTPTPVPVTTSAPRFVSVRLLVYYDGNDDRQPGAGEGIAGVSAQFYEVATNQLLTQGYTDERGNLEPSVRAQGPVRVSVPFFGFSQLVAGEGASIYLRVPPQPLSGEIP
jgi:hypothetical protein